MAIGGDAFRQVTPHQPLVVPAVIYNKLLALLKREAQHRNENSRDEAAWSKLHRQAGVIFILNDSGTDQDRFAVLGIDKDSAAIDPTTDEGKDRSVLTGVMPDVDVHLGRFVLLVEPIKQGEIGKAVVTGITACQLSVDREWHDRADIIDGDALLLKSSTNGAATILWKEAAGVTRWAIVRLCNRYEEEFKAKVVARESVRGEYDQWQNKWRYTVVEQTLSFTGYGGWQMKANGRTVQAFNGVEDPNDGIGEEGNGVIVDDDLTLRPAGIGAVVNVTEVRYGFGDTAIKDYWFHFENETGQGSSSSSGSSGDTGPLPGMPNGDSQDIRVLEEQTCVLFDDTCLHFIFFFKTWRHHPRKKPQLVKEEVEWSCALQPCGPNTPPPTSSGSSGSGGTPTPPLLDRWRPCGAEDDSGDIFLPKAIFNAVSNGRVNPTLQINGTGLCYQLEEVDVQETLSPFNVFQVYDSCNAPGCPQPCDDCVRIQTTEYDYVELTAGPNQNQYLNHVDLGGLEVSRAGLYLGNDGRWWIADLSDELGTWKAAYRGEATSCPTYSTFVLHQTKEGTPPAFVSVLPCDPENTSSSSGSSSG